MIQAITRRIHTTFLDRPLIKKLETFVNTDSKTQNVLGVNLMQSLLADELAELGFRVELVKNKEVSSGDLLIAERKGQSKEYITFITHVDTVLGVSDKFSFRTDKNYSYGPGIADMKAGVIISLEGLRQFLQTIPDHFYSLRFVSSPNEEMGSVGFQELFQEVGVESQICLGFEPSLPSGSLISSRSGNRWYEFKFKGIAAHSGRLNQPHVNAAHEFAYFISTIDHLNDRENGVSLNVGAVRSVQNKFNIVCGGLDAKLDFRFKCNQDRDRVHLEILRTLRNKKKSCPLSGETCDIEFVIHDDCPAMKNQNVDSELLTEYQLAVGKHESNIPESLHSGGAADINYFSDGKNFCLDGLGAIGSGMHTVHECIENSSLISRSQALADFLISIEKKLGNFTV